MEQVNDVAELLRLAHRLKLVNPTKYDELVGALQRAVEAEEAAFQVRERGSLLARLVMLPSRETPG